MSLTDASYPRVVVIGATSLAPCSATGITMVNLFHGWPAAKLAVVYDDEAVPDRSRCSRAWRLSSNDVPLVKALKQGGGTIRLLRSLLKSRRAPSAVSQAPPSSSLTHGVFTVWGDMLEFSPSNDFWRSLDEFRPEVIYSVLGGIRFMKLVLKVAKRYRIPVVPHFMDDWPSSIYQGSWLHALPRHCLLSALGRVLGKSTHGMTISRAMADEFQKRYGIAFEPFMNCVEVPEMPQVHVDKDSLLIGYVGGLHLNRWRALLQVADALQPLRDEGLCAKLVVYAPAKDLGTYGVFLREKPGITIGGTLAPDKILSALQSLDILLHMESFDEQDLVYTKLSISTKIPQYMAAAKPVLAFGPSEAASCRYVSDNGFGLLVADNSVDAITEVLRRLLGSEQLRRDFGARGHAVAMENHEAGTVRNRFRQCLALAAAQKTT